MRRRARKEVWDPVKNWDGKCSHYGNGQTILVTPHDKHMIARANMDTMAKIERIQKEDEEANATPVGGCQFRRME